MADQDQDKTEQPTAYRLQEARKRGETAKSTELVGSLLTGAFLLTALVVVPSVSGSLAEGTRATIALAGNRPVFGDSLVGWLGHSVAPLARALLPLVLVLLVVAVAANVLQTGGVFVTEPLRPDFKRLNPAATVKRLLSRRTLWEATKIIVKLALIAAVAILALHRLPALADQLALSRPEKVPAIVLNVFTWVSLPALAVLGVVAIADLLFTRRDFLRRMRMSRREIKDEAKRRDGDPEVKGRQRRLLRELLKKVGAVRRVADADLVITNPTHFAVAVQYRPKMMRAPIVLAKGAGFLAQRIRSTARRHGVPLVRSPELARAIYRDCDIDGAVPEALYPRLAPIYRQLLRPARAGAAR